MPAGIDPGHVLTTVPRAVNAFPVSRILRTQIQEANFGLGCYCLWNSEKLKHACEKESGFYVLPLVCDTHYPLLVKILLKYHIYTK